MDVHRESRDADCTNATFGKLRFHANISRNLQCSKHEQSYRGDFLFRRQLQPQHHRYWHYEYHEIHDEVGYARCPPHRYTIDTIVAIEGLNQRGDWVTREEVAKEERQGPCSDKTYHYLRPDLELLGLEDIDVEDQYRCLCQAQTNSRKYLGSEFALTSKISQAHW